MQILPGANTSQISKVLRNGTTSLKTTGEALLSNKTENETTDLESKDEKNAVVKAFLDGAKRATEEEIKRSESSE